MHCMLLKVYAMDLNLIGFKIVPAFDSLVLMVKLYSRDLKEIVYKK